MCALLAEMRDLDLLRDKRDVLGRVVMNKSRRSNAVDKMFRSSAEIIGIEGAAAEANNAERNARRAFILCL